MISVADLLSSFAMPPRSLVVDEYLDKRIRWPNEDTDGFGKNFSRGSVLSVDDWIDLMM